MLSGKRVVLGVTGGIACYKALEVLRLLTKAGADVHVVMTEAATRFVSPLTFRELSYHPVSVDLLAEPRGDLMQHLSLAETADIVLVAPATANTIAKAAAGMADNLLLASLLATGAPVCMAPAMDSDMYRNPLTQDNIARLKRRGVFFIGPEEGPLARGNIGPGRLADPAAIVATVDRWVSRGQGLLAGKRVLVTAGPTQEPLDPVRYLSNRSSGRMGFALAKAACEQGADVTLISGPTSLATPDGVDQINVRTALEMRDAVLRDFAVAHGVIMAAAVADFRFAEQQQDKWKKDTAGERVTVEWIKNPDIVAELGQKKTSQVIVGFAAETTDVLAQAAKKLQEKNLDMIAVNDVSRSDAGFGVDTNEITLMGRSGRRVDIPLMAKIDVARKIIEEMSALLDRR